MSLAAITTMLGLVMANLLTVKMNFTIYANFHSCLNFSQNLCSAAKWKYEYYDVAGIVTFIV